MHAPAELHGSFCSVCSKVLRPQPSRQNLQPRLRSHQRRYSTKQQRMAVCPQAVSAPEAPPSKAPPAEVTIRRRAPAGSSTQPCGQFTFKVPQNDGEEPQNKLEEIVWYKAKEIEDMKYIMPTERLAVMMKAAPPPRDFIGALKAKAEATGRPALIAEVKKASPSKGVIQPNFDPAKIAKAYEAGGAACISVLTCARYFQGSFDNLLAIRKAGVNCPLLCKEFVVEAYQLFKARACGADAVLLIAAVLPNKDLQYLMRAARKIKLQILLEVHSIGELERVLQLDLEGTMLGINNRDLQTFEVDLDNSKIILSSPAGQEAQRRGLLFAGESGIFTPEHVTHAQQAGCQAILVGESLVKESDQAAAVRQLLA
ncbi:hypothetical protein WJX84_006356 [Apatococcus fuscideae]